MNISELAPIECPYMPDGFGAFADAEGIICVNLKSGEFFRLPKFTLDSEFPFPESFSKVKVEGDQVTGYLPMKWNIEW